jgi:hypothetical protein
MNPRAITILRDLVPLRPLTHTEALRIAELQATRMLELSGLTAPPVPETSISGLPKIKVRHVSPWPTSGAVDWAKGTWVIVLNGAEPYVRQRFSLAHEFKHIIDHRFIDVIYPTAMGMTSQQRAETVCDYFAGCLLVPKRWLRQAWTGGTQNPVSLARRFQVSQQAIQIRLVQTGLTQPTRRWDRSGEQGHTRHRPTSPRYQRTTKGQPLAVP